MDLQVVIGLGISGFSCVRYLKERGMQVAVVDTRENPPFLAKARAIYPELPIVLGCLEPSLLAKAARIIVSPGISLQKPEIAHEISAGKPVVGDIELFAEAVQAPVLAITGTNAKSTVTTLVGEMAKKAGYQVQVGGNLGIPALDLLANNLHTDLYVLEISSFQLETTYSLAPMVAALLNITPDHLDRHQDYKQYQRIKQRIFRGCKLAVCNRDDPLTYCADHSIPIRYFTLGHPQAQEFGRIKRADETFLALGDLPLIATHALSLRGQHYQANALAALAIGYSYGLQLNGMRDVIGTFKGLPHRCELVRNKDGVAWYNDSKGTNVGATMAAMEGLGEELSGKLVMIMGGLGKNADFSPLAPLVRKYARKVILLGEAAPILASVLQDTVPIILAKDMDDAIQKADEIAKHDDGVLLSPACASFDMFRNFEHRGQVFAELVMKL